MIDFHTIKDEKLITFYNDLTYLNRQKKNVISPYSVSATATTSSSASQTQNDFKYAPIPEIWFDHNDFESRYNDILKIYFTQTDKKPSYDSIVEYYPTLIRNKEKFLKYESCGDTLIAIGEKGKENSASTTLQHFSYSYKGTTANYTSLNAVTEEIIVERSKFFKNKRKINQLIEKHKQLINELKTPCINLIKMVTDRVFLKTFDTKAYKGNWWALTKNIFLRDTGWMNFPPYFFNDSLYDLKNKNYLNYKVTCYVNLLPEASLALITKDLEGDENSTTFFKKNVKIDDVLKAVKKQAESERQFINKLDLEFLKKLFSSKLENFTPNPNKKKQILTVKLPYMGLDKLTDDELLSVATRIMEHYALYDRYDKYIAWFNEKEYKKRKNDPILDLLLGGGGGGSSYIPAITESEWKSKVANVLPNGYSDIPYLNTYISAIESGKFKTYYEVCAHVNDIRVKDETNKKMAKIAENQQKIQKQNAEIQKQNANIIKNQKDLYDQKERQHKEMLQAEAASYRSIMNEIDSVRREIDDITIYY